MKKLILARIYFHKLYIIGRSSDQNEGVESYNRPSRNSVDDNADGEFVKDIKDLLSPDQLPKDLKKLMIFDDVRAKETVINEYFCRGRHNNFIMMYLNQNLFTIDRQSVRENCNQFTLFEQRGKVLISIFIKISVIMLNLVIMILLIYVIRYGKSLIITLSSI